MDQSRRKFFPVLLFLTSGFLAGCVLPELLQMDQGTYAGLASRYSFQVYERTSADIRHLFFYVASVRLHAFLILWMSSFTSMGVLIHLAYAWWLTASAAMLLSLFGLQSGVEGILQFCCCIFPQWMIYLILWKREVAAWLQRSRDFSNPVSASIRLIRKKDFRELASLLFFCLLGCACEAVMGTWTLKLYLRMFG